MNQRLIAIIILVFSLISGILVYHIYNQETKSINTIISETGSCYLADGTCLHEDRKFSQYILGGVISFALLIFGLYLFIDNSFEKITKEQKKIAEKITESQKIERKKKEFDAFLKGFSEDKKTVLRIVYSEPGILQSTLRFKTNMSKTGLSLLLKDLEKDNFINRKPKGKTNQVFFVEKF